MSNGYGDNEADFTAYDLMFGPPVTYVGTELFGEIVVEKEEPK